ncbi:MAG: formylmethanofuran dehydrogenase [Gammaproteobacteria bacterium]
MPKPKTPESERAERLENVACPFCSLLCDDLSLDITNSSIAVVKNGCQKSKLRFEREPSIGRARIDGKRVSHKAAVTAAARILRRARSPLISGLGTDVEGVREAVHLAEKSKAVIDHGNSTGFDQSMRVLQSRGWYMTTLAELRNRADLVVIVGADIVNHYERFLRRYVASKQSLHLERRKQRRVFYLGTKDLSPSSTKACAIECLECDASEIIDVLAALRARVAGRKIRAAGIPRDQMRDIETLVDALKGADYPVFVWAPGHFEGSHADIAIQIITRTIDDLNRTQRAAGLALGGDNGGMSAANACTWLTGYPLHVSFAGKTLEYDPVRNRTQALIERNEIDALVWIDAFMDSAPPATDPKVKRIVIGLAGGSSATSADVFIPVGTPGVDHDGRLVRTDSAVSIRLNQVRPQIAPSVRNVVHAIVAEL